MARGEKGLAVKMQEGWAMQALGPRNQGRARRMGFQQEMEAMGGWWGVADRPRQPGFLHQLPWGWLCTLSRTSLWQCKSSR